MREALLRGSRHMLNKNVIKCHEMQFLNFRFIPSRIQRPHCAPWPTTAASACCT